MMIRKLRLFTILSALTLSLTFVGCGESGSQKEAEAQSTTNTTGTLAESRYVDPNGYFKIVPPAGWRIVQYPKDIRGKVAFSGPGDVELRVLSKGVKSASYDDILAELKEAERNIGVNTNIEKITFADHPAFKRTFALQGTQILFIDLTIGDVAHNLMFSAVTKNFKKHYALAWASINTFEPTLRDVSPEDIKKHAVAKSLRLAVLFFEQGNYDLALEFIAEGLAVDPANTELLELKENIANQGK